MGDAGRSEDEGPRPGLVLLVPEPDGQRPLKDEEHVGHLAMNVGAWTREAGSEQDVGDRHASAGVSSLGGEARVAAAERVYCSNAVIAGRFGLRVCVVNFRTEAEDIDQMLAVAAELGEPEHQRTVV